MVKTAEFKIEQPTEMEVADSIRQQQLEKDCRAMCANCAGKFKSINSVPFYEERGIEGMRYFHGANDEVGKQAMIPCPASPIREASNG